MIRVKSIPEPLQRSKKTVRMTIGLMGVKQPGKIRMLTPLTEREMGFADKLVLRARSR